VIVRHQGRRYALNPDRSAAYHARESTAKLAKMAALVSPGALVVLDVGANCGLFAALAARRLTDGLVVTFEPSPDLLPFIHRNCDGLNVRVEAVAVGSEPGDATLYVNRRSQQTNSLQLSAVEAFDADIEQCVVPVVTLDEYCAAHALRPDVLKIDVQGAEREVLRGAAAITPGVQQVFIEATWLDPAATVGVLRFAGEAGFEHLTVVNPVSYGADLLLSRAVPDMPGVQLTERFVTGAGWLD
jgi:FkbM family methyltransferase